MMKYREKSDQRGTLLVEALAMLGLIAMVTPTLYKKSAERLQEIQDINIASQARTMNSVVETMMKANVTDLLEATSSAGNETIILTYDDDSTRASGECSGDKYCFDKGYSAYVPFGFNIGEIKNYKMPTVYVHNDNSSLTSYIIYPKEANITRKRAAKIASLVGANGGMVWTESTQVQGTGDAWSLDADMITSLDMADAELTENSLVVTSVEPVTIDNQDSEKFLYRVPPEDGASEEYYHNMMVTDLYMGGLNEEGTYAAHAKQFHSIYNTRKLMLNTTCDRYIISGQIEGSDSAYCDPDIADLYIGRPVGNYLEEDRNSRGSGSSNTGAAWIYGNLSALNSRFRLHNTGYGVVTGEDNQKVMVRNGHDMMEFLRLNDSSDVDLVVFRADNGEGGDSAAVGLLDDFVLANESSGTYQFMVGGSSAAGGGYEGGYIHAYQEGGDNILKLNTRGGSSAVTYINDHGGHVYINQGGDSSVADTHINEDGGRFLVGENKGTWIEATGSSATSSSVYILKGNGLNGDARIFGVGGSDIDTNMIYADSSLTSLKNGQLRVYGNATSYYDTRNAGGLGLPEVYTDANSSGTGAMLLNTRYTDILSSTFMTNSDKTQMSSGVAGDIEYARGGWALGVAGSAWVDDLLYANEAWFNEQGSKNLHAGFSSYTQYDLDRDTGWLNVYGGQNGGVYIRRNADTGTLENETSSAVFWADSSQVRYQDLRGGYGLVKDGAAELGWEDPSGGSGNFGNLFRAESSRALVSASTLVQIRTMEDGVTSSIVDIQEGAMTLNKHPELASDVLGNRIDARAGEFALWTTGQSTRQSSDAQFFANNEEIRVRRVDFAVEKDDSSNAFPAVFKVMPDLENLTTSSDANVLVDGTVHVTGNEVIHIASNKKNTAELDSSRAMFEVDPDYIQVLGVDTSSGVDGFEIAGIQNRALFKIGAKDIYGNSSATGENATVYIRRGAIELEHSGERLGDGSADNGVGYIKADRLVSGARKIVGGINGDTYDQFMVNPAYTSVMHDIKLTTRGGARLSDILPDYVLKGVYNVSNNCPEGTSLSAGVCEGDGFDRWASPFVGVVPFAPCPPGYSNLATIVPISFQMAQAGELVKVYRGGEAWEVQALKQADVARHATSDGNIRYPVYEEASSIVVEGVYNTYSGGGANPGEIAADFISRQTPRVEGWFLGVKPDYENSAQTETNTTLSWHTGDNYATFKQDGTTEELLPFPMYFQQNTWLKTSLQPTERAGWNAYMGFIYDTGVWGSGSIMGHSNQGSNVYSNNNDGTGNETSTPTMGGFVWNLFPVPTNTIEGHATVYCYFNRESFENYQDSEGNPLVDQITLLGNTNPRARPNTAIKDDPSLKYEDPWSTSGSGGGGGGGGSGGGD